MHGHAPTWRNRDVAEAMNCGRVGRMAKGRVDRDRPGSIAMIIFAVASAGLGMWWWLSGDVGPAIGFGVLSLAWAGMALRNWRRSRAV